MPEYATAVISHGLEPKIRTDIFGEELGDAIVQFGIRYRDQWLSECSRHWMAWLWATKESFWPDDLLDLLWRWGDIKSMGKDETFSDLVDKQVHKLKKAELMMEAQPRLL